ncbi:MAG: Gfo/Idh/MocA family protein [Solirubrobacterales bacterium]
MEEGPPLAVEDRRQASGSPNRVRELGVGIVGAGFIGRVHARSARLAGGRIVGVAASTPERADAVGRELGAERGFASAEELVASADVDVVHVCTPNHLHLPLALAALAAGKHLVCEKPLALDAAGAAELAGAAGAAGTVATVPFAYRYYPTVREARARVRSGEAGELRLVHGGYLQDWMAGAEDDNWRVDAELGGSSRAFADIGSHWCDLVEFVSGQRIAKLAARLVIAHPERPQTGSHSFGHGDGGGARRAVETEDAATVLFETDHGAAGSFVVSQVSPGRKNRLWFEITGAEEALAFDQEQPETLWVGRREGARVVARDFDTLDPAAAAYVTLPGGHPQGFHDCFEAFVAETYAAIRDGEIADGLPQVADGLRAARITDAVLRSAHDGAAWVEVDMSAEPRTRKGDLGAKRDLGGSG